MTVGNALFIVARPKTSPIDKIIQSEKMNSRFKGTVRLYCSVCKEAIYESSYSVRGWQNL